MKIAGRIMLIFGILSFLGALLKGHSIVGPLFWLALGIFLFFRSKEKEQENQQNNNNG